MGRFFHGAGFFWIGSGFLADLDPYSEKKTGSETLQKTTSTTLTLLYTVLIRRAMKTCFSNWMMELTYSLFRPRKSLSSSSSLRLIPSLSRTSLPHSIYRCLAELGTPQHCRHNVDMFSGQNIVFFIYCIMSIFVVATSFSYFFLSLKLYYVDALSLSRG